jgi:hypothetical protein
MADPAVQCPICGQSVRNSVINEHIDSSCAVKNGAHDVVEVEPPAARQLPGGGLKIVSWNVDGLDDRGLHARAVAVCRHLRRVGPDVIMLQEVVAETDSIFRQRLGGQYDCVLDYQDKRPTAAYFTSMFVAKRTLQVVSVSREPLKSAMGRDLLIAVRSRPPPLGRARADTEAGRCCRRCGWSTARTGGASTLSF